MTAIRLTAVTAPISKLEYPSRLRLSAMSGG
jgi:hypothetical protein